MRQLEILAPEEKASELLGLAREHDARVTVARDARSLDGGEPRSLVTMQVPNEQVGSVLDHVHHVAPSAEVVVLPSGTLPLAPPLDDLGEQVHDVSRLSTFELVLGSLQSVGSWRGLLVYSALAGIIGAYGLVFDAAYLLVAAMLINPMAAPALVSVIGTSIGDARMTGRGAARFVVSLLVQTTAALLFGLAYGLSSATQTMEQVTSLSRYAVLLALAAGAAGAQTLVKSDRDSLVTGTAAGFMVAAALAPPAAVLGLSAPLGRWDHALPMIFLLALQYAAILVGGSVTLTLNGVRPSDPSLVRGRRGSHVALLAAGLAAVVGLVALQITSGPGLAKGDLSRRATSVARAAVRSVDDARLVQVDAGFTRPELDRYEDEVLLVRVEVKRPSGGRSPDALARDVRRAVRERVGTALGEVVPLVDVVVLPGDDPPPPTARR